MSRATAGVGVLPRPRQKLVLPHFDATAARAIGEITLNLALRRGMVITVCVARPEHTLYFSAMEGSHPGDESRLLERMRTVFAFGQSSLEVSKRLRLSGRILAEFGFDPATYSVAGGAIPLYDPHGELKGAAAVVGMSDQANHDLITEAACWHAGMEFQQIKTPTHSGRSRPTPAGKQRAANTSRL